MDVTFSMERICEFLSSLPDQNKKWLADRLDEEIGGRREKTSADAADAELSLESLLETARAEYREGKCVECKTREELTDFLQSL